MKIPTSVENYHNACDELAREFIEKYFGNISTVDYWWIANHVGEVLVINDYYVDCVDMAQFLELRYSKKDMFDCLDYQINQAMASLPIVNIRNWRKLVKGK